MYYMAFFIAAAVVLGVWLLLRSRWGLALTAIRDSKKAAESVGVNIPRVKFLVYVLTAAGTALAGALIFPQKLRITLDAAFSVNEWSAFVIFIVVIVGVIVFFLLREVAADWGSWYLIGMGAIAVAVMLIDRRGSGGN